MNWKISLSIILIIILCKPSVRTGLEDSMIGQMLIQIPLLAISGYLFGSGIRKRIDKIVSNINSYGSLGLLLVVFTSTYWILPRALDAALNSAFYETMKFLTVPLLIGLPLALSWGKLPSIVKGFVWANLISMQFVMGWLYAEAPIRLCNNYLTGQQVQLGKTLMALSLLWLFLFFGKAFFFGLKSKN